MDLLAQLLGYRKVGFIFCQSVKAQKTAAEGDYIINSDELIMMAAMQVGPAVGTCLSLIRASDHF